MDDLDKILENVETPFASVDALFDALRAERRRYVLAALQASQTPMALADLAHEVAERETDDEPPTKTTVKRIHASLYHVHIPKLVDAGVLEYDQRDRTVRLNS